MRTLSILFVGATVLTFAPVGQAASSLDVTLGSLFTENDIIWGGYLSGSWAVAGNDSISQDVSEFLPQAGTTADAAVTGADAGASALTQEGMVRAVVSATTVPGSSAAYAYAEQTIWFTADGNADLQFDMAYAIARLLSSQPNEAAFADASVALGLYREGGAVDTMEDDALVDDATLYLWNFVESGDSLSLDTADTLSVFGSFASEEVGYLWLRVDGQATAAMIPAPGALLLGAIGTGLAGLLRQRVL